MHVTSDHSKARGGCPPLWAAAAGVIGHALVVSKGIYDPSGLWWLAIGIVLAWGGLLAPPGRAWRGLAWGVCLLGVIWQLFELADPLQDDVAVPRIFCLVGLPLLGLLAAGAIVPNPLRRVFIPLLLACHFGVGVWLLRLIPNPHIDVYEVIKDSCQAMSRGQNPYTIDIPDIYQNRPDWEKAFYPPGFVHDGRVDFGYPYMPLNFAVAYGGYVLGGDFRLGNLLAITAAGGLLAYARRGILSAAAASLLLLTPQVYYVVERGWSEPAVVLCLALVVFCSVRDSIWLPWTLGLLMVSKQHLILAAPAAILLLPRPWQWKTAGPFVLKAVVAGAVVTLPMVLWNFHAFWHSAIDIQIKNPFRYDSLNFAAAWANAGHAPPPGWIAFALAAVAAVVAVWRAPRSAAGFAAATAVIYLCFFAVAKQAFCNYYFLTIGALCCAVAAWPVDEHEH